MVKPMASVHLHINFMIFSPFRVQKCSGANLTRVFFQGADLTRAFYFGGRFDRGRFGKGPICL